jgi:hypothetical protein
MNAVVKRRVGAALRQGHKKVTAIQRPIRILHHGVNVAPLIQQLDAAPELWDENIFRTELPTGAPDVNPHKKIQDIIVRFNDWKNWTGDRAAFNEEHESVWWGAYDKLPYIQPLVFDLMRMNLAERLGMVLITRIPPHCNVGKHIDTGWHAREYLKFGVQIKSAPYQKFCFEGYSLETQPGDLFAFRNDITHWVENPTDFERITLIICLRLAQPTCYDYKYQGKGVGRAS